jgi:hypothetical protein
MLCADPTLKSLWTYPDSLQQSESWNLSASKSSVSASANQKSLQCTLYVETIETVDEIEQSEAPQENTLLDLNIDVTTICKVISAQDNCDQCFILVNQSSCCLEQNKLYGTEEQESQEQDQQNQQNQQNQQDNLIEYEDEDLDFRRNFCRLEDFFGTKVCLQNIEFLFWLLTYNSARARHELSSRFPRSLFSGLLTEFRSQELFGLKDQHISEVHRCLCRLPPLVTDMILNRLGDEMLLCRRYGSDCVFYMLRFFDVFAFQITQRVIFFANPKVREQKLSLFLKMAAWFFKLFHRQRKIRDMMPMYRCEMKRDLKKGNIITFEVVKSCFDACKDFVSDYNSEFCQEESAPLLIRDFQNKTHTLYFLVVFIYNKKNLLHSDQILSYHQTIFLSK